MGENEGERIVTWQEIVLVLIVGIVGAAIGAIVLVWLEERE